MRKVNGINLTLKKLSPEQQIAWAKGKLVTSIFLKDIDGCRLAWNVLKNNRRISFNRIPNRDWRLNLNTF